MTATRQDKARWMAIQQLWEAKNSTDAAFRLLTSTAINFDRCGQPERGRECQEMANVFLNQSITINDLYGQLMAEEES